MSGGRAPETSRVVHLAHSLTVGGKERVMLDLAVRSRAAGHNDSILLFDRACDPSRGDLDPGALPVDFLPRRPGLDWRYPRRLRAWPGPPPPRP